MKVAIGLGASMGDRRRTLEIALCQLDATPGLRLVRASRWVRTPPMKGGTATGWFLNGVALFECERDVYAVLDRCRALEDAAGRRRARWWGDRPLDLDLIVAEGVQSADPRLVLPHPGVADRPFVLEPLREVWPEATRALPLARGTGEAPPLPAAIGVPPRALRRSEAGLGADAPSRLPRAEAGLG